MADRRKQSRHRHRCEHRLCQPAFLEPVLPTGCEFRRYGNVLLAQVLYLYVLRRDVVVQETHHSLDVDKADLRELEIQETQHITACRLEHPLFQLFEIARRIRSADHRTDRRSANDSRLDAFSEQRIDDAHVRPASRCAGTKRKAHDGRVGRTVCHWRRPWRVANVA